MTTHVGSGSDTGVALRSGGHPTIGETDPPTSQEAASLVLTNPSVVEGGDVQAAAFFFPVTLTCDRLRP